MISILTIHEIFLPGTYDAHLVKAQAVQVNYNQFATKIGVNVLHYEFIKFNR